MTDPVGPREGVERFDPALTADADLLSREEIAVELGISAQRVRQIERSAVIKCRRWLMAQGLDVDALLADD